MRILRIIVGAIFALVAGLAGTALILWGTTALVAPSIRPPSGANVYADAWDRGYVTASGTWTMDNARSAFPIQTSQIQCYRDQNSCTAAQAEIAWGNFLSLQTYNYNITKWDNTTILFRTETPCVDYVYTIDRANKRVFGTRTTKTQPNIAECSLAEKGPLTLTLADGFDVWKRLNEEEQLKAAPFMWTGIAGWWFLLLGWMWWRRNATRR